MRIFFTMGYGAYILPEANKDNTAPIASDTFWKQKLSIITWIVFSRLALGLKGHSVNRIECERLFLFNCSF